MIKQLTKFALIALLGSVALTGCAEDEVDDTDNNMTSANNTTDTTETDKCAGVTCDMPPTSSCQGDTAVTYDAAGTCDMSTGMCSYTAMMTDCSATEQICMEGACIDDPNANSFPDFENIVTVPKCDAAGADARCMEDLDAFTAWAPSSIISSLALVTGDVEGGFDYTGSGDPNNAIGGILDFIPGDVDPNATIQEAIDDGSIALVMEHIGLDSTDVGTEFKVGFLLAEATFDPPTPDAAGGNAYVIERESFDAGSFPQAVASAEIVEGGIVQGGPGSIILALELFGISLEVEISAAVFEATIGANSNLTDGTGVQLEMGNLGGLIRVSALFDAINDFSAENCGCVMNLGANGELIDYDANNLAAAACLPMDGDAMNCDSMSDTEDICLTLVDDVCGFVGFLPPLADTDADNPGSDVCEREFQNCNAISIALTFEAAGAKIDGPKPVAE